MASRVEVFKLGFGGDTSELRKETNKLNTELRQSKQEATALNKSLEFDPKNVKLLEKQMDALERAIDASSDKTDFLNLQLDELKKAQAPIDQIRKMEIQIIKSETETKKLQKEMKELDNIKVNADEFENLYDATQKNKKGFKQLTNEADEFVDSLDSDSVKDFGMDLLDATGFIDKFDGLLGGAAKTALEFAPAIGGAAAAIGLLTAGIMEYNEQAKYNQEYTREMLGIYNDTTLSTETLKDQTSALSKVFDVELSTGIEANKTALRIWGNEIVTNQDYVNAWIKGLALVTNEYIDAEEAISFLDTAQSTLNLSLEESEGYLINSINLIKEYGSKADDIIDSVIEFGDTAISSGISAEKYFDAIATGLELGAKNTDEVANAINELIVKTGDMTEEFETAANKVGTSTEEINNAIKSDELLPEIVKIIEGLSELEDQTERTTTAGVLFGTYGEEMIAPLAGSKQKVDDLTSAMEQLEAREKTVNEINTLLKENIQNLGNSIGLTAIQQENLSTAYEDGLGSAIAYLESQGQLGNAMQYLIGQSNLSTEAQGVLAEAQRIATEQNGLAALSYLDSAGALQVLADKGLIAQGQVDNFKASQDLLSQSTAYASNRLKDITSELINNGTEYGLTKGQVETFKNSIDTLNNSESTAFQKKKALTNITRTFGESLGMNLNEVNTFEESIRTLTSADATLSEKTSALSTATQLLTTNGFQFSKKNADTFREGIGKLTTSLNINKLANEDAEAAIFNLGTETATSKNKSDEFVSSIKNSVRQTDILKGKLDLAKQGMFGFGDSSQTAYDKLFNTNQEIGIFNSNPPKDQEYTITENRKVFEFFSSDSSNSSSGKTAQIANIPTTPQMQKTRGKNDNVLTSSSAYKPSNQAMQVKVDVNIQGTTDEAINQIIGETRKQLWRAMK